MTDAEIIKAYEARETAQNRTPQGADGAAILLQVAKDSGRTIAEVRRLVLDRTFAGPN